MANKQPKNPFAKNFKRGMLYSYLAKSIKRNFSRWQKKYTNLIGVHIGEKEIKGLPSSSQNSANKYSLVFHVLDKTDLITKQEKIPPAFNFTINKRKFRIPTDVIKTGESIKHYINPGQNVFQYTNYAIRGTIASVVYKDQIPHILTNMHVIGASYLYQTFSVTNKNIDPSQNPDISCMVNGQIMPVAFFRSGIVNSSIDAAIGIIPQALQQYINTIGNLIDTQNPIVLPNLPVQNPFPLNIYGAVSGLKQGYVVSTTAIRAFPYPLGVQNIVDLIVLKPCITQPGDSGSALFDPNTNRIVGIILGGDYENQFSFAISFESIKTAFALD